MEGSSSSFTDFLNSNTSANPENPTTQHQNFRSQQLPINYPPPSQFAPSYHPHYPYPFNPFGGQQNYPQFPSTPGSWHAFFGIPGSNNDINVLNRSTLFTEVVHGRAPEVNFVVNGNEYKMGYYLADGIYPEWATFVKTIHLPQCAKDSCFAAHQEGARKDVERAFGVLQSRFAILRNPARPWQMRSLAEIMYACIILHNMIVEDERDMYRVRHDDFYQYDEGRSSTPLIGYGHGPIQGFSRLLQKQEEIQNTEMHHRLKEDLVEHIFQRFGGVQGQALSGQHENI